LQEIFLEDDEPVIVAKMIDFLYCLDYDDNRLDAKSQFQEGTESIPAMKQTVAAGQTTGLNASSLVVNAKAYIMADKYEIEPLKEWAVTKYKEVLPKTWNSTSFIESASLIFENTPESDRMLRDIIIQKAGKNAKSLFDRGEFVALLQSNSDIAVEILRDVVFHPQDNAPEEEPDDWGFGMKKSKKKGYRNNGTTF
jgi:hypothetical protein